MTTRIIRSDTDAAKLAQMIVARGQYPLTVTIAKGEGRRNAQNRLSQKWYSEIAVQLGDRSHEEVRAHCKLHHGVPILRAENEAFRVKYDRILRPLAYAEKLDAIRVFDLPVTRLMTVKQMSVYMNEVEREFTPQGVRLTHPDDMKYQEEFEQ